MIDVTALGELLIDFSCLQTDGQGYPTMAAHPGGAPANFLATVSKLGGKTALLGKVGSDAFGHRLVRTLYDCGIDTRGVRLDSSVFTTLAFVTLDEAGDRSFSFARKPGADTMLTFDELELSLIDEARVFHFGTLSLTDEPVKTATRRAVAYAREKGKLISFDPNLRLPLWSDEAAAKEQMLWGMAQADVVKLSREEGEFLFGLGPEDCAQRLLDQFGVKLVWVTCGGEGCYFANPLACGWEPGLEGITPVDTTGAGDVFGGSAMFRLLETGCVPDGLTEAQLRSIARFANRTAGLSTTFYGGLSAIAHL